MPTMNTKNLTGVAPVDLGLGAGDQLKSQVDAQIEEQRKKQMMNSQQRQLFPATGMLLGNQPAGGING